MKLSAIYFYSEVHKYSHLTTQLGCILLVGIHILPTNDESKYLINRCRFFIIAHLNLPAGTHPYIGLFLPNKSFHSLYLEYISE